MLGKIGDFTAFTDVSAWAEIITRTGSFKASITQISFSFVLNQISTGSMRIALGVQPGKRGAAYTSTAHTKAAEIEQRNVVTVWGRFKGKQKVGTAWDGKDTVLYRGYVTGVQYDRNVSGAGLIINFAHWLIGLAATDKLTALFVASSASHMTREVVRPALTESSSGTGTTWDEIAGLKDPKAWTDLWGSIKNLFDYMARHNFLSGQAKKHVKLMSGESIANTQAVETLKHMDTGKSKKLAFKSSNLNIKAKVSTGLSEKIADRSSGPTFWGTLMGLSNDFFFSVVSTVNTATCVPWLPSVEKQWKTIAASEYWQLSQPTSIPATTVRSFQFWGWSTAETMPVKTDIDPEPTFQFPIGYKDLAKSNPGNAQFLEGQIITELAPNWLMASASQVPIASQVPLHRAVRCASNVEPLKENKPDVKSQSEKQLDAQVTGVADDLAHCKLLDYMLRSRQFTLYGRLRFDIAPGSSVAVEVAGKNVPYYRATGKNNVLYGNVAAVTISIDAEQAQASTSLVLTHVTTAAERANIKDLAMTAHPLYTELWDGTDLLDGKWSTK